MKFSYISVFFLSFIAIFFIYYSPIRVLFSAVNYIYGFAFLPMIYLFASNQKSKKLLFKYFACLGVFISIGLIIDSLSPVFKIFQMDEGMRAMSEGRATFLTENPTTLGVFYNFLLVCTTYCLYMSKSVISRSLYFIAVILFIPGAWVTGSRQVLLIIALTLAITLLYLFLRGKKNNLPLIFISSILLIFSSHFINNSYDNEQSIRFSRERLEEEDRNKLWEEGAQQFLLDNIFYWPIGRGIGSTTDKNIAEGEYVHPHYENTYLSRFAETGYLGLYLYLFPIFYALKLIWLRKTSFFSLLMGLSVAGYAVISFVSPNGASPQSQVALFLTIGLLLNRHRFDVESEKVFD